MVREEDATVRASCSANKPRPFKEKRFITMLFRVCDGLVNSIGVSATCVKRRKFRQQISLGNWHGLSHQWTMRLKSGCLGNKGVRQFGAGSSLNRLKGRH